MFVVEAVAAAVVLVEVEAVVVAVVMLVEG